MVHDTLSVIRDSYRKNEAAAIIVYGIRPLPLCSAELCCRNLAVLLAHKSNISAEDAAAVTSVSI